MNMRKSTVLAVWLVLAFHPAAEATWSVLALDRSSRAVVIASATCVPQQSLERFPAKDLRDVQAIGVPGTGIAAAQAYYAIQGNILASDAVVTAAVDADR
jgi:hypothetical protein